MNELLADLLTISVPLLLLALVLIAVARVRVRAGHPILVSTGMAIWLAVMATGSAMVLGFRHQPDKLVDPVAPPPQVVITVDTLQQCRAIGGVQLVLINDEWICVTPDQAG